MLPEFLSFPSIKRLSRDVIVSEKIDGTNAQIYIGSEETGDNGLLLPGSRNRWLEPGKNDNHGFAGWVHEHKEELKALGPGRHYGEWWGQGIARNYGLKTKKFSLFNVSRWGDESVRPACCEVVPTLYTGIFDTVEIDRILLKLIANGSYAAPGFNNPEGIVIFHVPSGYLLKKTVGDDGHKTIKANAA